MTLHTITARHNFETAHRLPHLGNSKCRNLHGHSWWATVTVTAPTLSPQGTVVEFGAFKQQMRTWIDTYLDHGAMLGRADPLLDALLGDNSKVFVFDAWPTVEAVAVLLADQAAEWLLHADAPAGTTVARVHVAETHVNTAEWVGPGGGGGDHH